MTFETILFFFIASAAIGSALMMITRPNPLKGVLFLILNFFCLAVLYLLLQAQFIAVIQILVYAGAIMVLFLFVVMLLGAESTGRVLTGRPWWIQPVPLFLGLALIAETIYIVYARLAGSLPPAGDVAAGFGDPAAVGELLFSKYLLPFEATSILLLAAMVGAIVLIRVEKK